MKHNIDSNGAETAGNLLFLLQSHEQLSANVDTKNCIIEAFRGFKDITFKDRFDWEKIYLIKNKNS